MAPKIRPPTAWEEGVWGRTSAPSPSRRARGNLAAPRGCDNVQVTSQCSLRVGRGMEDGQGEGQEPFGQKLGVLAALVEVMVVAG